MFNWGRKDYWFLHIFSLGATLFHGVKTQGIPEIREGPTSGVLIRNNQGILLVDRKLVSQTVFVDLNPERTLNRWSGELRGKASEEQDVWFSNHIGRTKESVKEALRQLEKTYVLRGEAPVNRDKRFIGLIIGLVVTTVAAAVIGSTMSVANAISVESVSQRTEQLKDTLNVIQEQIKQQESLNDQIIQVVNQTVLVQNTHAEMLTRSINLHEKTYRERSGFYGFVEPIIYLTQELLRETQASIDSLIQGKIPLYLVPVETVRRILKEIHRREVPEMQLTVAYEMGCAVTVFLDIELMQMAFIINLPLVIPENIYQMKTVVNVGTWKEETYLKVKTPELLAYQEWNRGVYLVPNLENCVMFKDMNYLCPGKPFVPQTEVNLCGVAEPAEETTSCDLVISKPDAALFNTVVVLLDREWLVSTTLQNLTISFTAHGTFKVVPIKFRVSLIKVPRDAVVTVGNHILFHVPGEAVISELEMVNVFDQAAIPIDEDLKYLLDNKNNHTVRVSISKKNVTVNPMIWSHSDKHMMEDRNWREIKMYITTIAFLLIILWLIGLTVVLGKLVKKNKKNIAVYDAGRKIRAVPATKIIEMEGVTDSGPL